MSFKDVSYFSCYGNLVLLGGILMEGLSRNICVKSFKFGPVVGQRKSLGKTYDGRAYEDRSQ